MNDVSAPRTTEDKHAASARRIAVDAVIADLRRLASTEGVVIHVYGSAVRGGLRPESDVDVLFDAPDGSLMKTMGDIEDIGLSHDIPIDFKFVPWTSPTFLKRVMEHAETLS